MDTVDYELGIAQYSIPNQTLLTKLEVLLLLFFPIKHIELLKVPELLNTKQGLCKK